MSASSLKDYEASVRAYAGPEDLRSQLLIHEEGDLQVCYAPFEYVNTEAKVVICGITPGKQQADIALRVARDALLAGETLLAAQRRAKQTASFAGPMRTNLVALLDGIGLNVKLGLQSTAELFSSRSDLVHYTSALRNPVLRNDTNYSGSPNIVRTPILRQQLETSLRDEALALQNAIWVPLGGSVAEALQYLARRGWLKPEQVLEGLPHPSGANAERISVFLGRKSKEEASPKTNVTKLVDAKNSLLAKLEAIDAWA